MSLPPVSDPLLDLLDSLSGQQVEFFPKSGNAGDGFIAYATYLLLEQYGIQVVARRQDEPVHDSTVLIGGGGNLIEGRYTDVATLIRSLAPDNRVILLPHSIMGYDSVLAETHHNLTVLCREQVSFELALSAGANPERTLLSNDVALFIPEGTLGPVEAGLGQITVLRTDGESSGWSAIPPANVDISLSWNGDYWHNRALAEHSTRSLAAFLAPYRMVRTDRLHVALLAAFLGKDVFLMPNAYFKNRAVFEHSLRPNFPNVRFVNTDRSVEPLLDQSPAAVGGRNDHRRTVAAAEEGAEALNPWDREQQYLDHIAEVEQERAILSTQLAGLAGEFMGVQQRAAASAGELEALRQRADSSADALEAISRSRSWRMTAPLRDLGRWGRGRLGRGSPPLSGQ